MSDARVYMDGEFLYQKYFVKARVVNPCVCVCVCVCVSCVQTAERRARQLLGFVQLWSHSCVDSWCLKGEGESESDT